MPAMKIESQAPIVGSALVGGMAQSWLVDHYPQWSWLLSLGLVGGGMYLGTRPGWQSTVGLGIASAGAAGLGLGLLQLGSGTQGAPALGTRRQIAARSLSLGGVNRSPAPAYSEEFEGIKVY